MSRKFKKFASLLMAIVMTLAISSVAFADEPVACPHDVPDKTYTQAVTVTLIGENETSGSSTEKLHLPSEYHVRVIWDVQNGKYNATKSDNSTTGGQKNFSWDCGTLQYKVNSYTPDQGATDFRSANWVSTPKVAFEVTNASTPDKTIYVQASLTKDAQNNVIDNWAAYMTGNSISTQNTTTIGKQTVAPVKRANMGTGVNSYEGRSTTGHADRDHNVYDYEYVLNWDYNKLNQAALDAYNAGTGTFDLTNTFVVTVSAK